MSHPAPGTSHQLVQSVDRAIELLNAVASSPEPETAPVLADRCALNRSTAWRLLATLEHHGLVDRDPEANTYTIGYALLRIASTGGLDTLTRRAKPLLRRLAFDTGETASLAVPQRLELVYVDQVQAPHIMAPDWLGRSMALHAASAGKVWLAWLPPTELDAALAKPLERFTDTTITDPATLRAELEEVRRVGYAISRGELEAPLWGVSAPVFATGELPTAVVSVWGSEDRVRPRLIELGLQTAATARDLGAVIA